MGNDTSSLLKIRRTSKDKSVIIECLDSNGNPQVYHKKSCTSRRSVSQLRSNENIFHEQVPPPPALIQSSTSGLSSRKSSAISNFRSSSDGSGESLQIPTTVLTATDRRRSRSLCAAQMKEDAQAVAAQHSKEEKSTTTVNGGGRKPSSGLVPSLNRLRIQQCYKSAKPSIGEAILKRAAATRIEMRAFISKLNEKQTEALGRQIYELISDAVEHADKSDRVLNHARQFGGSYAALCPLGFRPDLFTPIADAAIAECVKLDGVHKRCETLSAWSQLFSALFTSVRDGYYQRVRHQRRTSLPQNSISKQMSVDFSKSADRSDSFVR